MRAEGVASKPPAKDSFCIAFVPAMWCRKQDTETDTVFECAKPLGFDTKGTEPAMCRVRIRCCLTRPQFGGPWLSAEQQAGTAET